MSFDHSLALWLGRAAVALGLVATTAGHAAEPPLAPPPISAFFANSDISAVKLSPSGRHMALIVADKSGRKVLAVAEVDSPKAPVVVAASPIVDVRSFEWVNDDWLVYNSVDLQVPAYSQSFGPGLFSVRRDGTQNRMLIRSRGDWVRERQVASNLLEPNHGLLRVLRDGSNDVIVAAYNFNNLGEFQSMVPKRLDVSTGRSVTAVFDMPMYASEWIFDGKGVAHAVVVRHDGHVEVRWRDKEGSRWRSLLKAEELDVPWMPIATDDRGRLYVTAVNAAHANVLKLFDFATNQPEPEAMASAPGFDLDDGFISDGDDRIVGVRVQTDAETTFWFDDGRKKLQQIADARFPGRINRISCSACGADGAMLVTSFSDHDPGTFYVYRPATQSWTTVGSARTAIDPRRMADLDLTRIKARDGLDLPVWITKPRSVTGRRPAVLLVHGGPWVRGVEWEWNGEAQFLASRGYVVIEPEFRGSMGYGRDHFRAGWKNWSTTMQDDLADAVRWAAGSGLVDPDRVCIVGASYGGYAALMAPIRYPALFKCSVAWVAVSDPRLLFEESWQNDIDRQGHFSMRQMIGDPVTDAAALKAAAPLERASEIRIPLMMAYGSSDRRVPIEHGNRMRAAMRAAGQDPEFVVYDNEGHGFLKVENRVDFYGRVEKFLARNIGN